MPRNACSGTTRLSKGGLLSMMGNPPFSPPPMTSPSISQEQRDRILSVLERNGGDYNRTSVILGISAASLRRRVAGWAQPEGVPRREASTSRIRRFFEETKSPWSVRSFEPRSGEVCIEMINPTTTVNFGYKVPSFKIPD